MALGVKDKLGDIILEVEGGSKEEAAAALTQLSKMSRFAADIFD
jgi:sulfite reductase alpha subunit-like flavoprotein